VKIRQRLALRFTIVSALLTGAILILIYVLTRGFVHADFVERLTRQSSLEALHYATPHVRDVLPPESFLLVNPITAIYSEEGTLLHAQGDYQIPESWITFLKENAAFNAERGEYTTVGRRYDIDGVRYLVFVSDKDLPGQHELGILIKAVVVGWLVSLALAYLAGLYFSGNAMQPVNHVVKEVNQITKDNLGYRLKLDKDPDKVDEIDELVITFNALLNRIESAFVAQKRFVQHASHELKTPLTAIMAETELALAKSRQPEEYERTLQVIAQETERLETITQGLLTLARLEEGSFKMELDEVNICTLLEHTLATFRLHHPDREVVMHGKIIPANVRGNAQLLQIAVLNILDNAVKYSSGKIIVHLKREAGELSLAIEDFGIGIPAAELGRIRSPLFRGSNAGTIPGAGLGLSLADRIVKVHAGQLDITGEEGKGTTCTITLPTADTDQSN
jgi:signal transduction histidine kinase